MAKIPLEAVEWMDEFVLKESPRYLMGVGTPEDLVENVARGVDMLAPQAEYSSQVMKMLVNRALDVGLTPGTPEFRDFIMTLIL